MKKIPVYKINPSEHMVISHGEPCSVYELVHHLGSGLSTIWFLTETGYKKRRIPFDDEIPVITHREYIIKYSKR